MRLLPEPLPSLQRPEDRWRPLTARGMVQDAVSITNVEQVEVLEAIPDAPAHRRRRFAAHAASRRKEWGLPRAHQGAIVARDHVLTHSRPRWARLRPRVVAGGSPAVTTRTRGARAERGSRNCNVRGNGREWAPWGDLPRVRHDRRALDDKSEALMCLYLL